MSSNQRAVAQRYTWSRLVEAAARPTFDSEHHHGATATTVLLSFCPSPALEAI
jgi:hypothetical protein